MIDIYKEFAKNYIQIKINAGITKENFGFFHSLPEEKQKKIIRAALEEFSSHGYNKASTNEIVKNAGIGKGMLFRYFKSKKMLYLFLVYHSIDKALDIILKKMQVAFDGQLSFFEKIYSTIRIKLEFIRLYPLESNFFTLAFSSPPPEIVQDMASLYDSLLLISGSVFFDQIDFSSYRDDIPVERIKEIIMFVTSGFQNSIMQKLKNLPGSIDYDSLFNEFMEYIRILEKGLLK